MRFHFRFHLREQWLYDLRRERGTEDAWHLWRKPKDINGNTLQALAEDISDHAKQLFIIHLVCCLLLEKNKSDRDICRAVICRPCQSLEALLGCRAARFKHRRDGWCI